MLLEQIDLRIPQGQNFSNYANVLRRKNCIKNQKNMIKVEKPFFETLEFTLWGTATPRFKVLKLDRSYSTTLRSKIGPIWLKIYLDLIYNWFQGLVLPLVGPSEGIIVVFNRINLVLGFKEPPLVGFTLKDRVLGIDKSYLIMTILR